MSGVAAHNRDEAAFRALFEEHRGPLQAHCYRMIGSLQDAEDALQETMMKAWRAFPAFEGRSSFSTWCHRIATNVCIDMLRRRPQRGLPMDHGTPSDPTEPQEPIYEAVWIEPYPDRELDRAAGQAGPDARYEQREAVELAFIAALQHLPARQRAVLILRDVLGFSAREVATILGTTIASANGALNRARGRFRERRPERSQQSTLRDLGNGRVRELVERFVRAFEAGDVDEILALLAEDASFAMPPYPGWCQGRDALTDSWLMPQGDPGHLRYLPTRVNGQLALGVYRRAPDTGVFVPACLDVFTVSGGEISQVVAFRSVTAFGRYGLPPTLAASSDDFGPRIASMQA
jgi:RNA polymerase sigma-70 factor, ECF subfamily